MTIQFFKYQATGNDFVVMDNRDGRYDHLTKARVQQLCDRRFGIGADGLMLLDNTPDFDFKMIYFNSDGAPGSMCGNGGRCIVAFAARRGIVKDDYRFLAYDGEHLARISGDGTVSLKMSPVSKIQNLEPDFVLDTGSPHYIRFVNSVDDIDVFSEGRAIRSTQAFRSEGINVNFVEKKGPGHLYVRTYERGVEDETYSCGTGVTAAAVAAAAPGDAACEFKVQTRGGLLQVSFEKSGESFDDIWLRGPATFVFEGQIESRNGL